MKEFAEALKKRMDDQDLTQGAVAAMARVGLKTVQRIEANDPRVTKVVKRKVSRALGIPYDESNDPAPERRGPAKTLGKPTIMGAIRECATRTGLPYEVVVDRVLALIETMPPSSPRPQTAPKPPRASPALPGRPARSNRRNTGRGSAEPAE